MAQGLVRASVDICSGHTGYNPRPAVGGSLTVFCNGFPVVRLTDVWGMHSNGIDLHQAQGAVGSPTVFCEGIAVMRALDPLTCGSTASMSSLDTFAG